MAMDFFCNMLEHPKDLYESIIRHATALGQRLERKDESQDILWTDDVRFRMITLLAIDSEKPPSGILSSELWQEFHSRVTSRSGFDRIRNRTFFITAKGYMGTEPYTIEDYDRIVLFKELRNL